MRKTLLIYFTLLIAAHLAHSQSDFGADWKLFRVNYVLDKELIENQKLESDVVNAAVRGIDGSYWFAVGDEIKVYKNKRIKTIDNKNYGRPKAVTALCWAKNNTLWIGTTSGLYKMDGDSTFRFIKVPNLNVVHELVIGPKNNLYVSGYIGNASKSKPSGLNVFDGENWINYTAANSNLQKPFIKNITFDRKGNLWALNDPKGTTIVKFDGNKWSYLNKENTGLQNNQVKGIAFDSKNNAWFGSATSIVKFDGISWNNYNLKELIKASQFSNFLNLVDEPHLQSLAIDQNDVVWIGTKASGVLRMQSDEQTVFNVDNSPLSSNHIGQILIDDLNRKWFITGSSPEKKANSFTNDLIASENDFAGVVIYQDPFYNAFKDWFVMNTFTPEQLGTSFYEIDKDSEGNLWLASANYGILKYTNSEWTAFRDPNAGLAGELINCIAVREGNVFAGTQLNGLYQKVGDELRAISQDELNYGKKSFRDLAFDDKGNLWIAHIGGVDVCEDGTCKSFTKKNGLLSNNVFKLTQDSQGRMWVCTTKGISVFDDGFWTFYDHKQNGLNGYVYDVIEDGTGTFWAGTSKGLYKLEGETWIQIEPKGDGIPKWPSITCMAIDTEGTLWIGTTANAVLTLDKNDVWKHYNATNSGMVYSEVSDIAVAQNGDVWICTKRDASDAKESINTAEEILRFDPSAAIVIYKKPRS